MSKNKKAFQAFVKIR